MRRLIIIITLLTFFEVMLFSTSLIGGQNTLSKSTPNKTLTKATPSYQIKSEKQIHSSRISFYYLKIKTLLSHWFEPREPIIDDDPCLDGGGPSNGEYDDVTPIKDNGGLGVDK